MSPFNRKSAEMLFAAALAVPGAAWCAGPSPRVGASAGVWIEGGATDCGDWLSSRKTDRSSNLEHYVVGMLNGMVLANMQEFWRADGASSSQAAVFAWIDNYCSANPLERLPAAVTQLYKQRTSNQSSSTR